MSAENGVPAEDFSGLISAKSCGEFNWRPEEVYEKRIAELEAERNLISDSETKLAKECVEKQSRIDELEAENKRLRECISAFLLEATPWLDVSGAMYNQDLADCAERRLRNGMGAV